MDFATLLQIDTLFKGKIERSQPACAPYVLATRQRLMADAALHDMNPEVRARVYLIKFFLELPDEVFVRRLPQYQVADYLIQVWSQDEPRYPQPYRVSALAMEKALDIFTDPRTANLSDL